MNEMTYREEINLYKRVAKQACAENGIRVFMKDMELLETGYTGGDVDYVMFEDRKDGTQYQCYSNWKFFTSDHPSRYMVNIYQ